jgi:hypothetical protein
MMPVNDRDVMEQNERWNDVSIVGVLTGLLLGIYLAGVLCFGYWYWMRPVRADQFKDAQMKWRETALIFGVPVPKDERWGV